MCQNQIFMHTYINSNICNIDYQIKLQQPMKKKGILKNQLTQEQKERQKKINQQTMKGQQPVLNVRKRKSLDNFYLQAKKNMEPITQQDQGRSQDYSDLQPIRQPHSQTLQIQSKVEPKPEHKKKEPSDSRKKIQPKQRKQIEKQKQQPKVEMIQRKQIEKQQQQPKVEMTQRQNLQQEDQENSRQFIHVDNEYSKDIRIIAQQFRYALNQTLDQVYSAPENRLARRLFQEQMLCFSNAYLTKLKSYIKYNIVPEKKQVQVEIPVDPNLVKQNQIYQDLLKTGKQRNRQIKIRRKSLKLNPQLDKEVMIIKQSTKQLVKVGEVVEKLQKSQHNYQEELSLIREMQNICLEQISKEKQRQISLEFDFLN